MSKFTALIVFEADQRTYRIAGTMQTILSWLLKLVGFDAERLPPDADVQLAWTNAPQSWKVFVLLVSMVAISYGVVYLYRREIATCPAWCKRLLIGIRLLTLLILLAIFLGPAVAPIQHQVSFPTLRSSAMHLSR